MSERFRPLSSDVGPPVGKIQETRDVSFALSHKRRGDQPKRRVQRDPKRWPETLGYPPVTGGSDWANNYEQYLRENYPGLSNEEIKQKVQRREQIFSKGSPSEMILETMQEILEWWSQDHPKSNLEDIMRHFANMPEEKIRAFKKAYPQAFRKSKRRR